MYYKLLTSLTAAFTFVLMPYLIKAQTITAHPDTTVCSGESVTLYADLVEICTDCYTYKEIPYAIEPIGGTTFSMFDDTHTGPFEIGFSFCFFGEEYTDFYLSSNGWISFEEPTDAMDVNWTPTGPIPDASFEVPSPAIFSPWTDWNTGLCTDCLHYEVFGDAPNRRCAITWEEVPLYECSDFLGTFQIVLLETSNFIENHFEHVDICPSWDSGWATQGVQNIAGDFAYTVTGRNATDWSADDESWRWFTSEVKWYEGATLIDSGATTTVTPDVTTVYTVVQTLCDGTTYTDDVTVNVANNLTAEITTNDVSCGGAEDGSASIVVTGSGGPFTYEWSSGETDVTSVTGLSGGEYFVTVTSSDGCVKVYSFIINEVPELVSEIGTLKDATCFEYTDGEVSLTTTGGAEPYTFEMDGSTQPDGNYEDLAAGDYTVTVTDANGCSTVVSFTITQPDELTIYAGEDVTIPQGASYTITATTPASLSDLSGVSWGPTGGVLGCDTDPCLVYIVTPPYTTTYLVSISDLNGCSASDYITITVKFIPEVYFPTAFSPNGDNINDLFQAVGYNVVSYNLRIFDRWGEMVYETSSFDYNSGWNGTINGDDANIGSYVYQVNVNFNTGDQFNSSGNFMLVR